MSDWEAVKVTVAGVPCNLLQGNFERHTDLSILVLKTSRLRTMQAFKGMPSCLSEKHFRL